MVSSNFLIKRFSEAVSLGINRMHGTETNFICMADHQHHRVCFEDQKYLCKMYISTCMTLWEEVDASEKLATY